MDSRRVLYIDYHAIFRFFATRQTFEIPTRIIGQNDEKSYFDIFSSLIRNETAIFEIKIFC